MMGKKKTKNTRVFGYKKVVEGYNQRSKPRGFVEKGYKKVVELA